VNTDVTDVSDPSDVPDVATVTASVVTLIIVSIPTPALLTAATLIVYTLSFIKLENLALGTVKIKLLISQEIEFLIITL